MKKLLRTVVMPFAGILLLTLVLITTKANAQEDTTTSTQQTATISTDKPDYAPRSTATFTGSGFAPYEDVELIVKNLSYPCNTVLPDSSYTPWTVQADSTGSFVTEWTVCDCNGDSLRLKATGQTSGLIAKAYFTDALFLSVTVTGSSFCVGAQTTVSYTALNLPPAFASGNVFTAQLSNASGSFTSPVNIGTLTSTSATGNISATIPLNTPAGTGYRIRVISSNPAVTGPTNTANLTINTSAPGQPTPVTASPNTICAGSSSNLNATSAGNTIQWYTIQTGGSNIGTSASGANFPVSPASTTTYYAEASNACGVSATRAPVAVAVNSAPSITTTGAVSAVCSSAGSQTTSLPYTVTTNNPVSYSINWVSGITDQGTTTFAFADGGGTIDNIAIQAGAAAGNYTGTMTITNANGCTATHAVSITVNATPSATPAITGSASVCALDNTLTYSVTAVAGASYTWAVPTGWTIRSGQGTNSLSVTSGVAGQIGNITVTVSNSCGTGNGSLAVNFLNDIGYGGDPTANSATTCQGTAPSQQIIGGVAPSGPAYQWQVSINGGAFANIPTGATGTTYTISSTYYNAAGTYKFHRVISSSTTACNGSSDDVTLIVNAVPTVAALTGAQTVCAGSTTTFSSTTGGGVWGTDNAGVATVAGGVVTGISAGTANISYTVTNASQCSITVSRSVTVNALPTSVTITPSTSTICNSDGLNLKASATTGLVTIPSGTDNFDVLPTKYVAAGTTSGLAAAIFTQRANGYSPATGFTFTTFDGGSFMISGSITLIGNSQATSTLTSPVINTNNYSSLTLSYRHVYLKGTEANVNVQASTDGGTTWANIKTYSASVGTPASFAVESFTLPAAYLNQSNLKIRFNYAGPSCNCNAWWAIDNVTLSGASIPLFSWTSDNSGADGLPAGSGAFSSANANITVHPTSSTTYTLAAEDGLSTCPSSTTATSTVTVNQKSGDPTEATASTNPICSGGSADLTLNGGGGGTGEVIRWYTDAACTQLLPGQSGSGNGFTVSPTTTTTYWGRYEDPAPCNYHSPAQSVTLAVNTAPAITIQPTNQTTTYGTPASFSVVATGTPAPTYQWQVDVGDGSGFFDIDDATSATFSIDQPTVDLSGFLFHVVVTNSCSTVVSDDVSLTVNPLAITITADAQSKTYGDVDPELTAQVTTGTIVNGDAASGSLERDAGEDVGSYAINQGTYTYGSNYSETYVPANLTINTLAVSVTADAQSKTYGDADPALTFVSSPAVGTVLANGQTISFTGSLARDAGEDVGSYAINQSTLDNSNYTITYTGANLTINPLAVSVTADAKSKTYGDDNPTFDATVTGTVNGDVLDYTLGTTATQFSNVGNYPITVTLGANPNYTVTPTDATLNITPKTATVAANNNSKTYGDDNPTFDATVTGTVNGDVLDYTLGTTATQFSNVGDYPITVTLGVNPNYSVTPTDATLNITPKTATVAANNNSKTYGDDNPAFDATVTGAVNGDVLDYTLGTTATQFSNVGDYPITVTLGVNPNYSVTPANGTLHINPKAASVTPIAAGKHCGDADPVLTGILDGFIASDNVTAIYTRTPGETVAGSPYTISATLSPAGVLSNYTITYNTAPFTITDVEAPVISALPGPSIINCPATPLFATATATDCSPYKLTYADVTTYGSCAGNYTVTRTWTATDSSHNVSTASQTITVQDVTAPVISGGSANITLSACTPTATWTVPTAFDACSGVIQVVRNGPAPGSTFAPGTTTTITYTATDPCGNTSSWPFTVTRDSTLSATVTPNPLNQHLYYGFSGDQTVVINVAPIGGKAPYTVNIRLSRNLIANYVNAAGDETWTSTISSGGIKKDTNTVAGTTGYTARTGGSGIGKGGYLQVSATLLDSAALTTTVTDANGCIYTRTDSIFAEDVRCFAGNSGNAKVQLCHQTGSKTNPCVSICVDPSAVAEHLAHGDALGPCPKNGCGTSYNNTSSIAIAQTLDNTAQKLEVKIMPNPSVRSVPFTLTVKGKANEEIEMRVLNMLGQVVYNTKGAPNETYKFGSQFMSGIYLVEVRQGENVQILKVIKQ